MLLNGVEYEVNPDLELRFQHNIRDSVEITARWLGGGDGVVEAFDSCPSCQRFSVRPKVARSLDEAEAFGWLRQVS